jgi:DNA-binding transcriptional LysR family regulator
MDVDSRVLRYFVAVAEHRSFTQAARAVFVAQPSLSRQIKQLETRFGADLFTRSSTEVRLTAAGEVLLEAARRQLADWQDTVRQVRAAAAEAGRVLRVGFVATGGGALARRARTALSTRNPYATVAPKRCDWGGEVRALREGLVDVAFVWLPADTEGLHTETVGTEARFAGMARTHPLTQQENVSINDLNDSPLPWTRLAPADWVDWWAVNPRPDGSTPVWGPVNDNVEEMLDQVAATDAVCIAPESMGAFYDHPDLAWRPITDVEPLRIALAWPHGTTNPLVPEFVRIVRELAGVR